MVAMLILSVVGIAMFKGSIDILAPRQWTLVQNITDAYLTYEKAYAQRIPYDEFTGADSPWPVYPATAETSTTLGTLPGGHTVTASITRTRIPDANNLPAFGGSGTVATNPAELQTWKLQSHVVYNVNGRQYIKSRTIVRTQ